MAKNWSSDVFRGASEQSSPFPQLKTFTRDRNSSSCSRVKKIKFQAERFRNLAMGSTSIDPGGGNSFSYAKSVKNKKFEKLDRNILEIVMEKKVSQKTVSINCEQVVQICHLVGIQVGDQTEGYQAHYNRKSIVLSVWVKDGVSLERFATDQPKDFSSDLTITQVRPAHRKEVTLLVTGLSFNTPDGQVKHYVESFGGKMVGVEPIYGVFKKGPWKGQYNGDRRYKVDFSNQIMPMGTYHLLNNDKIRVVYHGNTQTCGRCHQAPASCPGGGIARACGEQGGDRMTLLQHMKYIWSKIKYDPDFEHKEEESNVEVPDLEDIREESFTGPPSTEAESLASGGQPVPENTSKNEDDRNEEDVEGSEAEDEEESEDDENDTTASSTQLGTTSSYIIPGLPKPLTKNQKKKIRKNKRKDAITPPEPKDAKVSKLSVASDDSLVTNLIRKYSSNENNEHENEMEGQEESVDRSPSPSPESSSQPPTTETSRPSTSSPTASLISGSVIQTGVI